MARCYSGAMPQRYPALPHIWLISDARNDAQLERALANLPRGSGLIYRHYHLAPAERRARFDRLARLARRRGHWLVLAGSARDARSWRADGAYGSPTQLAGGAAMPRLVTAHSLAEIGAARHTRADAILLSPVFATRSHPGAATLGALRFRLLAAHAGVPVIALGGMTAALAQRIGATHWAAIDGLIPKDS
ncbi:thiamine phosphate synthase [Novosphingobium sp. G106]|uniref:thiamine phosphate synthase n=1 Tax=Novosphingobium sp. G106 TaxID=2849500 RepID=UPI001C2DB723|nr:thiamine phosphate synthase [Novosphingobium sp. G106]MBV1689681.1 thiamine phosphate synthase [Novosphingobium sp. G106]